MFGPDGDDVAVVEPDAFEDELEHVPFRLRVGLVAPEEGEVVEDLLGLVEVGKRLGCELGELSLDLLAAGEVVAAVEVAEFVQVAQAAQSFFERGALARHLLRFGAVAGGEAVEDLLAQERFGLEVGHELDELFFDQSSAGGGLVTALARSATSAEVASLQLPPGRGPLHARLTTVAVGETAEQIAGRGPAGVEGAGAGSAQVLNAIEEFLVDDCLMQAADLLAAVAPR
ncbi:MAG TPA: hypothetical protein VMG74_06890 [Gaiellaceae bacterium]|nr:hypothetical protein [Gaiellaceae bacterium]